jgi:hypothetical protein
MTDKQIRWAKTHDWFLEISSDGWGVLVLDVSVDRVGVVHTTTRVFTDYYRLRNWAGY